MRRTPLDTVDMGKGAARLKGTRKQNKLSKKGNGEQPANFSEQLWGTATTNYFRSVAKRTPQVLQDVVGLACTVLQEDGDGDSSGDDQSMEGEVDSRALMCKLLILLICHTDTFIEFHLFHVDICPALWYYSHHSSKVDMFLFGRCHF